MEFVGSWGQYQHLTFLTDDYSALELGVRAQYIER